MNDLALISIEESISRTADLVTGFALNLPRAERLDYLDDVRVLLPRVHEILQLSQLHFIGFTDDHYHTAVRVFGPPDFVHRVWDHRARYEIVHGDTAIFAKYHPDDEPSEFSWNDSERF